MLTITETLDLVAISDICDAYRVQRLAVFGSFARGESRPDSDVDLLVEYESGFTPSYFKLVELSEKLRPIFGGRQIDLVLPTDLHWFIRKQVLELRGRFMKDDRLYLIDMLETARASNCAWPPPIAEFDSNEDLQLALTHLLQMIGEAATRVSEISRLTFASIDWRLITGMRHRIVHDYMQVNLAVVWETATEDIPALIVQSAPVVDPIIAEAKRQRGQE